MAKLFGVGKCVASDGSGQSCNVQDTISNLITLGPTTKWGTPVLSLVCVVFLLLAKYVLAPRLPRRIAVLANTAPLLVIIATGEERGVLPWEQMPQSESTPGHAPAAAASYSMPTQFKGAGIGLAGAMPSGVPGPVTPKFPGGTLQADTLALFTQAITVTLIGPCLLHCQTARSPDRQPCLLCRIH